MTGEEKKHVWLMILLDLFLDIGVALVVLYTILRYVVEFCISYILSEVILTEVAKILLIHMGITFATWTSNELVEMQQYGCSPILSSSLIGNLQTCF